jgi:hypothetical protein
MPSARCRAITASKTSIESKSSSSRNSRSGLSVARSARAQCRRERAAGSRGCRRESQACGLPEQPFGRAEEASCAMAVGHAVVCGERHPDHPPRDERAFDHEGPPSERRDASDKTLPSPFARRAFMPPSAPQLGTTRRCNLLDIDTGSAVWPGCGESHPAAPWMCHAQRPSCAGPCLGAQRGLVNAGRGRRPPGHVVGPDGARAATRERSSPHTIRRTRQTSPGTFSHAWQLASADHGRPSWPRQPITAQTSGEEIIAVIPTVRPQRELQAAQRKLFALGQWHCGRLDRQRSTAGDAVHTSGGRRGSSLPEDGAHRERTKGVTHVVCYHLHGPRRD